MQESKKYSQLINHADRAVSDSQWIREVLAKAPMGVVATAINDEDGCPQPFVSTLLYVYDEERHAIYIHTAKRGRVWSNAQANPRVCFTVNLMGRLLPADTALNFSVEYSSVVAFGKITLVEDSAEAEAALQKLLDRYFHQLRPKADYRPITQGELSITAVFRIDISEWSGKKKEADEDFPGAFTFGNAQPQ